MMAFGCCRDLWNSRQARAFPSTAGMREKTTRNAAESHPGTEGRKLDEAIDGVAKGHRSDLKAGGKAKTDVPAPRRRHSRRLPHGRARRTLHLAGGGAGVEGLCRHGRDGPSGSRSRPRLAAISGEPEHRPGLPDRGAGQRRRLWAVAVAVRLPAQRAGLQLLLPAAALHLTIADPENVVALVFFADRRGHRQQPHRARTRPGRHRARSAPRPPRSFISSAASSPPSSRSTTCSGRPPIRSPRC